MEALLNARRIADYILLLPDFRIIYNYHCGYGHIGATLTDAVLQAGVRYQTVVKPRVLKVLANYPAATTVSAFLEVLQTEGTYTVLNWRHPEKPKRLHDITIHFASCYIDTEYQMRFWLLDSTNCHSLLKIRGVGPKTIDYLRQLVGAQSVAVDRHIQAFVRYAGVNSKEYDKIKLSVEYAADLLDVPRSNLDHSIWLYMTKNRHNCSCK